jgi:hypothetical protein
VDRDLVLKGIHHIDKALAFGKPAATILHHGAELCDLAATFEAKYIEQGVDYLEDAVKEGLSIKTVQTRCHSFVGNERFEALRAQPEHGRAASVPVRHLDPWYIRE